MDILSSCTFELEDIEIIDHKTENEEKLVKWQCDQCSLFFLEKEKLAEHKKKHGEQETVKCKYCSKKIPNSSENREGFVNRKCETCEYKCSKCPQRFLRHSSLMNHEKKHSSPKKKKTFSVHKANGVAAENIVPSKVLKRKLTEAYDSEEQSIKKPRKILNPKNSPKKKEAINVKAHNSLTIESACNKMSKRMSLKSSKSPEGKSNVENTSSKTPKRISSKTNKLPEEKNSDIKVKHNSITINSTTFPSTSNVTPNSENVVNYKPFSCHVCGDTFASDSALLDHIRTHGESAAKTFQCKFCSDKFDDIYKMQYHLAICPLAEDELESSLKRVIPANIPLKYSGGTSSPRKRGRPKKTKEFSLDQTDNDNESTPFSKRGTFRKRKSEIKEIGEKLQVSSSPVLPKQKKLHQKAPLTGSNSNTTEDDAVVGAIIADVKESEPNDDKKKLHHCPFPRCDFKFTREKALLCHMRNHSDDFEDSLKCHKCDIPFDDIHTLRLHINTCKGIKEERDEDFSRAGCYDSSPNRTSIKAKKDFLCIPCGRSYQNQEKLNSHNCQGAASNSISVKFPCRLCGEPLHDQNMMKTHFQEQHPNNLQFQCPTCVQEFDLLDDVNSHMMEHMKYLYDCIICLRRFDTRSELNRHYNEEHPKDDRTVCLVCNKRFADASGLAKHRHVHTGERPYFCPFCFQTFNLKCSQVNHVRRHTNFRPYQCHLCPVSCFNSGDLKKHIRLHTGEKPYRCDVCNAQFRLKDVLNAHMKKHANIRPFTCFQCPKAFKTRALLRYHLAVHTGIRSFVCPVCPEKYFQMTSLRSHIRRCHVTDDLKCVMCDSIQGHRFDLVDHILSHRDSTISVAQQNSFESLTPLGVKKKRGQTKKNSSKLLPNTKNLLKTTLPDVGLFKMENSYNYSSDQIHEEYYDETNLEGNNEERNQEEFDESHIIESVIDIKEEIPFEDEGYEDQSSQMLFETIVIEQCHMCAKTFATHKQLMEHVYIHI